jgi:tetratricopeptide (TPR) repeat protein
MGLLAGTIAGIVGSPVMVRFPTAQKRLALLVIIVGVIPAIIMVALPRQDALFHAHMAYAYYNRKMFLSATRHFERAYQLDPYDASVNSDLAVCYAQIGMREASLEFLGKAVAVDRRNRRIYSDYRPVAGAYKNLAVAYYNEGLQLGSEEMIADAAENFAEYIQLISDTRTPEIDTFYDLINAYLLLNQPDQALPVAEQAAALYPDDTKLQEQLAQLRKAVPQKPPEKPSAGPSDTGSSGPSGGTSETEKPGEEKTQGEESAAAGSGEREGRGAEKTGTPSPE